MHCARCGTVYPKAVGACPVCKTGAEPNAKPAATARAVPGEIPREGPVPDTPIREISATPRPSRTPRASADPGTRAPTADTQPWLGAPDVDDVLGGRYRIVGVLGKGGRGVVYRAEDMELNEAVAIKLLQPMYTQSVEEVARLKLEIVNARRITHPNVVRIHDLQFAKGMPFISMELLTGGTLRDRLRLGTVSVRDAFNISLALADGLAAVHKQNIIHRDIKPENILFNEEGVPKLVDFGIARLSTNAERTRGVIRGTPQYMSPEQFRGEALTPTSDIYSFGVVMYRMFTDKVPFRSKENLVLARMHQLDPPLKPRDLNEDIPPEIERIILQCLEKEPEKRFPSGRFLRKHLRAVMDRLGWERTTDYSTIWSVVALRASQSLAAASTTTAPISHETVSAELPAPPEAEEDGSTSTDVQIIPAPESVTRNLTGRWSTGLVLALLVALFAIGVFVSWLATRIDFGPAVPTPQPGRVLALPRTTDDLQFQELGYLEARDYVEGTYAFLAFTRVEPATGSRELRVHATKDYWGFKLGETKARELAAQSASRSEPYHAWVALAEQGTDRRRVEYRLYQAGGVPDRLVLRVTPRRSATEVGETAVLEVKWPF